MYIIYIYIYIYIYMYIIYIYIYIYIYIITTPHICHMFKLYNVHKWEKYTRNIYSTYELTWVFFCEWSVVHGRQWCQHWQWWNIAWLTELTVGQISQISGLYDGATDTTQTHTHTHTHTQTHRQMTICHSIGSDLAKPNQPQLHMLSWLPD